MIVKNTHDFIILLCKYGLKIYVNDKNINIKIPSCFITDIISDNTWDSNYDLLVYSANFKQIVYLQYNIKVFG